MFQDNGYDLSRVVVNELLTYVQNHVNSLSFESLRKLLLEFYSPEEIKMPKVHFVNLAKK